MSDARADELLQKLGGRGSSGDGPAVPVSDRDRSGADEVYRPSMLNAYSRHVPLPSTPDRE